MLYRSWVTFITAVTAHSHSVSVSELTAVKDSLCPLFLLSSIHLPLSVRLLSNYQSDSHHSCAFWLLLGKCLFSVWISLCWSVITWLWFSTELVLKSVCFISVSCVYLCLPLSSLFFLCNNIKHGYRLKQLECAFQFMSVWAWCEATRR